MKVEIRTPKSEENPNVESRMPVPKLAPAPGNCPNFRTSQVGDFANTLASSSFQLNRRRSAFGFRIWPQRKVFGFRVSAFGFTLIELLIVIAIMAILASLIFPVTGAIKKASIRSKARAEMNNIATAIESYKAKVGHYPPDNPARFDLNQLYYELLGTTNNGANFTTLDGATTITAGNVNSAFNTGSFVNSTKGSTGDEAGGASRFLKNLKPGQYLAITTPANCTVLGGAFDTTNVFTDASNHKINPWNYNSSHPTNNPQSFDLWIDIPIGGHINRICNWSDKPIVY